MAIHVFVTRQIPDKGISILRNDPRLEVDIYEKDQSIPRKELLKRANGAVIILSVLTEKIDAEVFDATGPQLKMIANYAVGFDNIDMAEAKKRGIVVTNAADPMISETVAEHAIALMFALAHRIVEADAFARAKKYTAWGPQLLLGTNVVEKTLGIIGTGAIGTAIVHRMHDGFGMKIVYNDVNPNPKLEKLTAATFLSREELLKVADFISLHVPLLPATHHLISTKEFGLMKPTAFLINTSRGPVVDEKALLAALQNKQIAGAGLDVYECEPAIDCDLSDTLELRQFPNVILTPHTASATVETRQAMSRVVAENILAFVDGKTPPNMVKI